LAVAICTIPTCVHPVQVHDAEKAHLKAEAALHESRASLLATLSERDGAINVLQEQVAALGATTSRLEAQVAEAAAQAAEMEASHAAAMAQATERFNAAAEEASRQHAAAIAELQARLAAAAAKETASQGTLAVVQEAVGGFAAQLAAIRAAATAEIEG